MHFGKTFGVISSTFVVLSLFESGPSHSATLDCSHTKNISQEVFRHAIKPGDRPDRELVQVSTIDVWSSNNPDLDGVEEKVHVHLDHVGATGSHNGYSEWPLNTGETLWVKFNGTHALVTKGDTWEVPYQGVFRIIAGTGKYKGVQGGGWYQGVTTENGKSETLYCTAEY
jgi:hypothetical protein